ncbi:MAG TPA: tetratricopeptide repeat-containing protein kinase family protein, partial [Myxococcales bacterium]|nr:tetratricopeptide repeat-containing protein kinase family protein [Myxococcales bacterium]
DERTDQFSFAVALYEALYGIRPFAAKNLVDRLDAVQRGQIQPPPAGHGVPEWMGQAVRRALSAEPSSRFPTMDALLEALQKDARKGRANLVVAAAVVAVATMAAGGAVALRPDQRCKGAEQRLAGAWDPDRREAIHRAFAAFPGGEGQFERTAAALDRYARAWTSMSEETCAATRVRGDQPESVMALRVACLDLRLHELQYLAALFASADQKLVDQSVDAAAGLSSVRSCADVSALTQEVPLPEDTSARDAILKVKEQLTEVNALRQAGRYKEALEKATAAVERAQGLRFKPVEGEALLDQGWLLIRTGEVARSIEVLKEAMFAADAGRADLIRARAASQAVYAAGQERDFVRGKDWARLSQAVLDRAGGNVEYQGGLLVNLGLLQFWQGQHAAAAGTLERARQILASELGHDDKQTLNVTGNLAVVYQELGRLDEAIALLEGTIASLRRRQGPDHPLLVPRLRALALAQLERHDHGLAHRSIDEALRITRARIGDENVQAANVLDIKATIFEQEHRFEEALVTYRRSLEIKQKALPADDHQLFYPYDGIGQALLGLGRAAEAKPMLERALATRSDQPHHLAATQYALAQALWQLGQQKPAALRYAEQALDNYKRAGKQERAVEVEGWMARRR